jgi:glycerol-3-phosphate acyltransferase PlsY
MFPIWLKFKGGKGIATYLGVLYALSPFVGGGTTVIWLCMFRILRISAAAGIISVVTSLVIFNYTRIAMCWDFLNHLYVLIGLVALIIAKHYDNLKRMMEKIRSA